MRTILSRGARVDADVPPIRADDSRYDEIVAEHIRRIRAEGIRFYDELDELRHLCAMETIRSQESVE